MQKARSHPDKSGLLPLVGVWFQVLFHSLVQSSFHLSLTVLVHYRSLRCIQPYRMVPADSDRISHVPPYSGYYQVINKFHIRDCHALWFNFPEKFYYLFIVHIVVLQPHLCRNKNGLGYFLFARHYSGNHYCFLFLQVLRCFTSLGSLTQGMTLSVLPRYTRQGFPIRKSPDQRLIITFPKLIADSPRPSSLSTAKAFTVRP